MSKRHPANHAEGAAKSPPVQADKYLNPGVIRHLYTSRLIAGLPYQRPLNIKTVTSLVKRWNCMLMEPLVVSYRDGRYYVIDGQHRVAALRVIFRDQDTLVPCIVHTGLTYADEAELFYALDQCKKKLSCEQSVNALLQSGANAEINDIYAILDGRGFIWTLDRSTAGDYKIRSTRTVIRAYRLLGREAFARMLTLLSDTWHGDPASLTSMMLSGTALFLKTYETEINDRTFVTRFSGIAPDEIVQRAKTDLSTPRNDIRCARSLVKRYNTFLRRGKLNPLILV